MSLTPRFVALALGLCAAAAPLSPLSPPAVAMSPAAPDEEPLPEIHISPTSGPVDGAIAISGDGCHIADASGAVTVEVSPGEPLGFRLVIGPDHDGHWATVFRLPVKYPSGTYRLWARCWPTAPSDESAPAFEYAIATYMATEAPPPPPAPTQLPELSVSPTSGPAGTVVTVSGENCVHPGLESWAGMLIHGPDGETLLAHPTTSPSPDGSWSLSTTIPADAPVGTYAIFAMCGADSLERWAEYPPATFTVTAPAPAAATAVPGRPDLTG